MIKDYVEWYFYVSEAIEEMNRNGRPTVIFRLNLGSSEAHIPDKLDVSVTD